MLTSENLDTEYIGRWIIGIWPLLPRGREHCIRLVFTRTEDHLTAVWCFLWNGLGPWPDASGQMFTTQNPAPKCWHTGTLLMTWTNKAGIGWICCATSRPKPASPPQGGGLAGKLSFLQTQGLSVLGLPDISPPEGYSVFVFFVCVCVCLCICA